jgi:plastocyanin
MRRRGVLAVAALVALAAAPAAHAQGGTVQAVDGTAANGYKNQWSPPSVTVKPGDAVTWSFAGSQAYHNVQSTTPNWSYRNGDPAIAPPPASYTFSTPGTYEFVCQIHSEMKGSVVVTDASGNPPPPPPPPPPSEQPYSNDAGAPSAFEVEDALRPRLTRLQVRPRGHGVRVRFRIDEAAIVRLRVERAGLAIKQRRAMLLKGRRTLRVRGLEPGAYRVTLVARALAGNRSRVRHARVAVRGRD